MKKWKQRIICLAVIFCLIITSVVLIASGTKTAYGATCPEKGHEDWNYKWICGCSVCGGKYVNYEVWNRNPIDPDGRYLTDERAGSGTIVKHYSSWTDGNGDTYTDVNVTYRCYNCGYRSWDGTIYNKNTFEDWNNVITWEGIDSEGDSTSTQNPPKGPQAEDSGGKGEGPGAVPWYKCDFCLGLNVGSYKHEPCYTITAKVSDAKGGTVSLLAVDEARVKVSTGSGSTATAIAGKGASIRLSVSVKDRYEFRGWSGGEAGEEITVVASADRTYTADVSLPATPSPTPEPGRFTITFIHSYYTRQGDTGEETFDGSVTESYSYAEGAEKSYTLSADRTYNGKKYALEDVTVSGGCGLEADGFKVSGTVSGNGTVETRSFRNGGTEPHVHEYGDWIYDDTYHWKECTICGDIAEKGLHTMTAGEPGPDGTTEYVCDVCGYTKVSHRHEWIEWCAYDWWDEAYDPDVYHWKRCAYDSCGKTAAKAKHTKGKYVDEGGGSLIARCTVCRWIMDELPVTVSLTFDPNGGAFPDGSTEPVTIGGIVYGKETEHWKLPAGFLPENGGMEFRGWFIVTEEEEGCVYTPDYGDGTCTGTPGYFKDNGDGTHSSRLKKSYTLYAQWKRASYTVEYDGNGANGGIMYPSHHDIGVAKALTLNGYSFLSRVSYRDGGVPCSVGTTAANTAVRAAFLGWAETAGGIPAYTDGQTVTDLMDRPGTKRLYAVWDYGSVILPDAEAADGGSRLSGWRREDGSVIPVLDGAGRYTEVTYPVHGDEVLTAVWVPNTYTVSFDSDGGTECAPITVTYKKEYSYGNSGLPTPRKKGYVFAGWKISLTNEQVGNSTIVTTAADHTLTAVWMASYVRVVLDYNFDYDAPAANPQKNPGPGFMETDSGTDWTLKKFDEAYGELPVPTRDGYTFACWYLEDGMDGNGCGDSGCLVSGTTLVSDPDTHVLHARWEKDRYRVDLDYNYDYSVWGQD